MSNHILNTSPNFTIVWWSGNTSERGIFIERLESSAHYEEMPKGIGSFGGPTAPQCFIELEWVPGLIAELRQAEDDITLLNRVTYPFVPFFHRRPKKDGGNPKLAYYSPLIVRGDERTELADALQHACSQENVAQAEANGSDWYYVLNNRYLEGGVWRSMSGPMVNESEAEFWDNEAREYIQMPAHQLAIKQLLRAPGGGANSGGAVLRVAKSKRACNESKCIAGRWIKANETYVVHRRNSSGDTHIKCSFRSGLVPANWLNPHFEQYHALVALGFEGWILKERKADFDAEKFELPWGAERVEDLITKLEAGYELDAYEKREWRLYLTLLPIDVEPYANARKLLGMSKTTSD